jgi:hypothetical protein
MGCQPRMLEPSKPKPSSKLSSVQFADGHGEVLPHARKIHETDVYHLYAVFFAIANTFSGVIMSSTKWMMR